MSLKFVQINPWLSFEGIFWEKKKNWEKIHFHDDYVYVYGYCTTQPMDNAHRNCVLIRGWHFGLHYWYDVDFYQSYNCDQLCSPAHIIVKRSLYGFIKFMNEKDKFL